MALGIAPFEGVQASSDRTSMMSGGTGAFKRCLRFSRRYAVHKTLLSEEAGASRLRAVLGCCMSILERRGDCLSPTDLRIAPSDTGARDLLRRSNYGDFGRGGDPDLMPMGMMHVRHVLVAVAHRLLAMQVCVRLS